MTSLLQYEGERKDGKPHGQGSATFTDGAIYDGYWEEGKQHGQGKGTCPEYDEYDGDI
jgi:hypothetical protein